MKRSITILGMVVLGSLSLSVATGMLACGTGPAVARAGAGTGGATTTVPVATIVTATCDRVYTAPVAPMSYLYAEFDFPGVKAEDLIFRVRPILKAIPDEPKVLPLGVDVAQRPQFGDGMVIIPCGMVGGPFQGDECRVVYLDYGTP